MGGSCLSGSGFWPHLGAITFPAEYGSPDRSACQLYTGRRAFVCQLLKELAIEQGISDKDKQFDFAGIISLIADRSSDHEKIEQLDKDLKITVLNDSLFLGIIRWFNAGKSTDGLNQHLLDIVYICLHGIFSTKE